MVRGLLTPDRLRQSGIFNPDFVRAVVNSEPHQRLRWHYFLLWQMIGVEIWLTTFARGTSPPADHHRRSLTT